MEKNMNCRGLAPDCFDMIRKDEGLWALLNHIKGDRACCLEVRHNYLSCYYRGGSMLKLAFNPCRKTLTFRFDPKYVDSKKSPKSRSRSWRTGSGTNPEIRANGWTGWTR